MQYCHNHFFLMEAVIPILVYYRGHFSSCLTWKNLPRGHFSSKMSNYSTAGEGGGVTILRWKMTPVNIYSMGVIILLYTDLSTQATHDFLYFNILWMIKYFLYHCWSMSAFYGYIEIFGLEVPWKHKNLMSLYLFHYKWISHDSFKTSWPVPLKALSEPYITYEFLSAWYLHLTVLLLIFSISATWNTAFSRNWLLEFITSVVCMIQSSKT